MLTQKQKDLLLFIHDRLAAGKLAPSFEEMQAALGLKSKSGIHRLISALVERGYIERLPHRARALRILRLPGEEGTVPQPQAFFTIPLYGAIAAGTPAAALADTGQTVTVPAGLLPDGQGAYYALTVEGESMSGAGIQSGDMVLIRRTKEVPDGAIAVVLIDRKEATLKHVHRTDGQVILTPANDAHALKSFAPDRVEVQGHLAALLRTYS